MPDVPGSHLLDGVSLVQDQKIVREKKTALSFFLFFRAAQQNEEQRVIDHQHVRGQQPFPRLLIKASGTLAAGLGRADVAFAANLAPDFWVGFDGQVAQRTVPGCSRPFRDPVQLVQLRAGEKFIGLLKRALQAARTKIILASLHQGRIKLDRQNLFQDRDILVQELLLKIDGVGGDDGFLFLIEREQDRRGEISERFAHARARFYHQMSIFL